MPGTDETSPTSTSNHSAEPDWESIGDTLFSDVITRFVRPEMERRSDAGLTDEVRSFQVLLPPDGDVEVRFNEEVGGMAKVKMAEDASSVAGEDVFHYQFVAVTDYEPRPEVQGVPHITGISHRDGWSLAFNFSYIHPQAQEHLSAANEFFEAATAALAAGHLRAFADNAFSTTELLAKVELLCAQPTMKQALKAHGHDGVSTTYNSWARLENTKAHYAALLNRLRKMRNPARYLRGEFAVKDESARQILATIQDMKARATEMVEGTAKDEDARAFHVVATREIRAGELVTTNDFTLKQPKK